MARAVAAGGSASATVLRRGDVRLTASDFPIHIPVTVLVVQQAKVLASIGIPITGEGLQVLTRRAIIPAIPTIRHALFHLAPIRSIPIAIMPPISAPALVSTHSFDTSRRGRHVLHQHPAIDPAFAAVSRARKKVHASNR
ncbi:MAG: hypothetical protein KAI66_17170, partial [Lentisphaeria bacterium]|nr:hypothetical protein [Lentisphaeria bacterium]